MKSLFTICNSCKVTLEDEKGNLRSYEFPNITCTAGRVEIARRLIEPLVADIWVAKYIAVWDMTIPPAESDTALWNEIRREELLYSLSSRVDNVTKVYARFYRWYPLYVAEAGLFIWPNAISTNGSWSLLCHSLFPVPIDKLTQEIMTIEWTISVENYI